MLKEYSTNGWKDENVGEWELLMTCTSKILTTDNTLSFVLTINYEV